MDDLIDEYSMPERDDDYNVWEEQQVFLDREFEDGAEDLLGPDGGDDE
jgi:hypothetical protein